MIVLKTCPDCSKIIVDDGRPHTCTPPTVYDHKHPLVASLLEADAARPRPLETTATLRDEIEERSAIGKKWVALADERGTRIIALETELAELKAANRYQRGFSDGQAEGHARIADLEAMLREAGNALVKSPCVHGASSPEACAVAERVMFGHAKCLRCRALTKLDQSGLLPKVQP